MKTITHNEHKRCVCMNCGYSPLGEYHISVEKDIDPNDLDYDFNWHALYIRFSHRCPICGREMHIFDSAIAPEVSRLADYFYTVISANGPVPDDVEEPHNFGIFNKRNAEAFTYYGPYIMIDLSSEYNYAVNAMLSEVEFRDSHVTLERGSFQRVTLFYKSDELINKQNYSLEEYHKACAVAMHEISIAVTELRKFARKLFSHEYYIVSQCVKEGAIDSCAIKIHRADAIAAARQNRRKRKYKW